MRTCGNLEALGCEYSWQEPAVLVWHQTCSLAHPVLLVCSKLAALVYVYSDLRPLAQQHQLGEQYNENDAYGAAVVSEQLEAAGIGRSARAEHMQSHEWMLQACCTALK